MTQEEYKEEAQRLRPHLMEVARRYLDNDDAEDTVQDALMRLWQMVDSLRMPIDALARVLRPLLRVLYPHTGPEALAPISANMSANLLGLGNAATPPGIQAIAKMKAAAGHSRATDDMCMLIVVNTASIQLIPATVAALRLSAGAAQPFDILPAVWLTSLCSVCAGIAAARGLALVWRRLGW